jgi:hypothetical protein
MVRTWTAITAGVARAAGVASGALALRTRAPGGSERGDVPGWVLVTLMTAGLVSVLWFVAGDALVAVFQNAISTVTPAAP